jgi:integrase
MQVGMGLVRNQHGVWIVRIRVPQPLQEPVACVLNNGKDRQTWLQKSTRTKDRNEAKRVAVDVLADFRKTLGEAETLLAERPLRTSLAQSEIDRIAEYYFASRLAGDEEFTREGGDDDDLVRSVAKQLDDAGVSYHMPVPLDTQRPVYGLSDRQATKRDADLAFMLPIMQRALSRGDVSKVSEAMVELLDRFHLNVDRNSVGYRTLGLAVLRAEVRVLDALERRSRGEPIDTPPMVHLEPSAEQRTPTGHTLPAAFVGWKKDRNRSASLVAEYERACDLFVQLHGNLPVAKITRDHARRFREALQDVPYPRSGKLAKATLPELVEWRRTNPDAPRIKHKSVNKLFGGVQSIVNWARENGMITAETWNDPFHKMQLDVNDPTGGPFEPNELKTLFGSAVFTGVEPPRGGHGDVAFWLPMLALFTGARRGELAALQVGDVIKDEAAGCWTLAIHADEDAGKTLKTKASARTIPVHPELVRLGFLTLVETARKRGGNEAWLFPPVSPSKPTGSKAWSKWFGKYLRGLGITVDHKGIHSLRHNFKDVLRAGSVPEDLNDALMGHSLATIGRSYGARAPHAKHRHKVIVERFGIARLIEAIAKVNYPTIDLQAVCWRAILDKKD